MPETIVLKPIIIKAWEDSSPGNSFTGWAGSRLYDPYTEMDRLWDQYQEYAQNAFWNSLNSLPGLKWIVSGLNALLDTPGDFITWLNGLSFLDNVLGKQNTPLDLINGVESEPESAKTYDKNDTTLSGGIASPFKAMAHYLQGHGEALSVPLNQIGLNLRPDQVKIDQVNQLDQYTKNPNFVGTKHIVVDKFGHNTADDNAIAALYLGNISLKLEGDMTRHQDGTWNFQGEAHAWSDTYDFNSSTHRGMMQELFTRTVNLLPGTPYEISMPGSVPISWEGH